MLDLFQDFAHSYPRVLPDLSHSGEQTFLKFLFETGA